jgi:hypothetical protein
MRQDPPEQMRLSFVKQITNPFVLTELRSAQAALKNDHPQCGDVVQHQ